MKKEKDIRTKVALELLRRGNDSPEVLAALAEDDLLSLVAASNDERGGSGTRDSIRAAIRRHRGDVTVREAVLRACSARALTSAEVIEALDRLRPDTPSPTVRAEIKRLQTAGELLHAGPQIGGTFRTIPRLRG